MSVVRSSLKVFFLGGSLVLTLCHATAVHSSEASSALFQSADNQAVLGDLASAIEQYREGLELAPANHQARVRLAHLLRNAGDRNEAIVVLKTGVDSYADSALLHVRLGELMEANENPASARKHYDRAAKLEPKSQAGIDAAANLADLESRSKVTTEGPSIRWSKGPKKRNMGLASPSPRDTSQTREFGQLDENLSGSWCLEWTDRYRRDGAMCVSDPTKGGLDLRDFGAEVSFQVNADKRTVGQKGLDSATGMEIPVRAARSIERGLGNRTVVQTVVFDNSDYLEFTFGVGNQSRQCMQLMGNRRNDEHRLCANRYTFCRCETSR